MVDAKAECEDLMNTALPFAEQMLSEDGEFFPFGVVLTASDECRMIGGYDGREQPPSTEIVAHIKERFVRRARRGQIRATALAYDARIVVPATGETSDAIAFALDHRDSFSMVVFIPYKLEAGAAVFADAITQHGERDIFRRAKRPWWALGLYLIHNFYARMGFVAGIFALLGWLGVFAQR